MKNNNENSTRFFSDAHEKSACKALNGHQTANSGAGHFSKGDVLLNDVSLMIECKTCKFLNNIFFHVQSSNCFLKCFLRMLTFISSS